MRYARGEGFRRIDILGATGKREDHTLGNISLLFDYMRQGLDVTMQTDYGSFTPCHGRFDTTLLSPRMSALKPLEISYSSSPIFEGRY